MDKIREYFGKKNVKWTFINKDRLNVIGGKFEKYLSEKMTNNSLVGETKEMEYSEYIQEGSSVVYRTYTATILLALDNDKNGYGSLYNGNELFINKEVIEDMDVIECNGDKCRQDGREGVYCNSCYAVQFDDIVNNPAEQCVYELEHLSEGKLFNKRIKLLDIDDDMVLEVEFTVEDEELDSYGAEIYTRKIIKLETKLKNEKDKLESEKLNKTIDELKKKKKEFQQTYK